MRIVCTLVLFSLLNHGVYSFAPTTNIRSSKGTRSFADDLEYYGHSYLRTFRSCSIYSLTWLIPQFGFRIWRAWNAEASVYFNLSLSFVPSAVLISIFSILSDLQSFCLLKFAFIKNVMSNFQQNLKKMDWQKVEVLTMQ